MRTELKKWWKEWVNTSGYRKDSAIRCPKCGKDSLNFTGLEKITTAISKKSYDHRDIGITCPHCQQITMIVWWNDKRWRWELGFNIDAPSSIPLPIN